ncbi:probable RNA-binding protein CG14230 [Penaeus japonicus]|uniref:probable RNA-binding protein CG14230 n=1 Tax=Penaeus japonicus TaxID=27405 RepID=UPI001C717742|nr:probable RNA-binding protein CG14230 [Penaeus japonicus]
MPRLFVGGLSDQVDKNAVEAAFSDYGHVTNVDFKEKTDPEGNVMMKFAFVNLEGQMYQIQECVRQMNGYSWHGSQLRVEVAKESFLDRLKRERMEAQQQDRSDHSSVSMSNWNNGEENRRKFDFNQGMNAKKFDQNNSWENFNRDKRREKPSDNGYMKYGDSSGARSQPKKSNATEETMMTSFKKYSSVWNDSEEEDSGYGKDRKPRNKMDESKEFIDSDGGTTADEEEGECQDVGDVRKEQRAQLKLLESMQGSNNTKGNFRSLASSGHNMEVQPIIRYDPTRVKPQPKAQPKQPYVPDSKPILTDDSKYVKVSKDLDFTNKSSGFSLLAQFDDFKDEEKADEMQEEEPAVIPQRIEAEPPAERPKRVKQCNFFLTSKDRHIEDALKWMPQSLTEDVSEEFYKVQPELRSLYKRRAAHAVRRRKETSGRNNYGNRKNGAQVSLGRDHRWRDRDGHSR